MKITYRVVQAYVDEKDNLIVIPTGESKKFGRAIMGLDIINQLNMPYSDEELENTLKSAFSQCFTNEPDDTTNISSLEKFLKIKGYAKAVKNRRLVVCKWDCDDGYIITPTKKVPKEGFVHMKDNKIVLGKELKDGELSKAFKEAMKLSST